MDEQQEKSRAQDDGDARECERATRELERIGRRRGWTDVRDRREGRVADDEGERALRLVAIDRRARGP